jgi:hypothetical protein
MDNVKLRIYGLLILIFFIFPSFADVPVPVGYPDSFGVGIIQTALPDKVVYHLNNPSSLSDIQVPSTFNGSDISPFVGLKFDETTGDFYYSSTTNIVVLGTTIPLTIDTPVSTASIAHNILKIVKDPRYNPAVASFGYNFASKALDFFITPADACIPACIPVIIGAVGVLANVVIAAGMTYSLVSSSYQAPVSAIDVPAGLWCIGTLCDSSQSGACILYGHVYQQSGTFSSSSSSSCSFSYPANFAYVGQLAFTSVVPVSMGFRANVCNNGLSLYGNRCQSPSTIQNLTPAASDSKMTDFLNNAARTMGGAAGAAGAIYSMKGCTSKLCTVVNGVVALSSAIDIVAGVAGMVKEGTYTPDTVAASGSSGSGSRASSSSGASVPISAKTLSLPDGSQTKTNQTAQLTFNTPNPGDVSVQQKITTTPYSPTGVASPATVETTAPAFYSIPGVSTGSSSSDICAKDNTILACQHVSQLVPEVIATKTITLDFHPGDESGSCPAPYQMALRGVGQTYLSFDSLCSFLQKSRYILIAMGYLIAGFTVLDSVKV